MFNREYFNIWQEAALGGIIELTKRTRDYKNNKILIVIPCLIGEFASAAAALSFFIAENKDKKVDLLVSPALKSLAERLKGVNEVFVVEKINEKKNFEPYEKIIIMRMNKGAYRIVRNISAGEIKTTLFAGLKYVAHLTKNLLFRSQPKT